MPRYKIMFSVLGSARFLSHLDLLRLFERACRRAGLPMAYSQGFNPHPKISIASPLAVSIAGEREFLEIELTEELNLEDIIKNLNKNLVGGIKVLAVQKIADREKPLMSQISRATYLLQCDTTDDVEQADVDKVINKLLQRSEITIERNVKGRVKTVNIRPGILALNGTVKKRGIEIEAELRAGSQGSVRLDELLQELKKAGLAIDCASCRIYRTGLYGEEGNQRKELW